MPFCQHQARLEGKLLNILTILNVDWWKKNRYISKKEKEDAILEAAQKEAEAREVYLRSQIGECTLIYILYLCFFKFYFNIFSIKNKY